jgi:hypothetical protein
MADVHPDCQVKVAVLEERIDNFERLFLRLDAAIDKIAEVNNNVSKVLAVHEERLSKQEKVDEVLFDKIDQLRITMDRDHASVLQRIQVLERKLWSAVGGVAVLAFMGGGGPGVVMKMLQADAGRVMMNTPQLASIELHRHQVHQPGLSTANQVR